MVLLRSNATDPVSHCQLQESHLRFQCQRIWLWLCHEHDMELYCSICNSLDYRLIPNLYTSHLELRRSRAIRSGETKTFSSANAFGVTRFRKSIPTIWKWDRSVLRSQYGQTSRQWRVL